MTKKGKKRRLNKKKIFFFLVFVSLFSFSIYYFSNVKITNIYISGNIYLKDQEIIDIAKITNYPKSINNLPNIIEKRLENNSYILSSDVKYDVFFKKVYINIQENYPLFYYLSNEKTVLYDGSEVNNIKSNVTLINKVPNTVYDKFLTKIRKIDTSILNRISEIEYKPNEVDEERFFIIMNDGNYVYINLNRFLSLNKYLDMLSSFENKKGILYLDSGEYFEVFK